MRAYSSSTASSGISPSALASPTTAAASAGTTTASEASRFSPAETPPSTAESHTSPAEPPTRSVATEFVTAAAAAMPAPYNPLSASLASIASVDGM